ncbi:RNA polymerase sigma-70 factor [Cytophagaceae bacterium YF14B1]|uniref:RNA polymerase sigma-70 factor n=1 Tax=Xanthocytophaga flava TaxID=3048013 RepID=A0AAE3QTG8_9BACT|nr:RNA polymerase sigma-70 factor [Xanthocytophaga flavus]MDJ1485167.1 RNA polymerase sigma-70 factor [Xanthocytophaga flavus]
MKNTLLYDDKEYVILLKQGSQHAFDCLFKKYAKKVMSFLIKFLRSEEEAKDALHDIFLKIWENRESLNENLSFNSYLFTIARNQALHILRDKKLHEQKLALVLSNSDEADQSTETSVEYTDLSNHYTQLVDRLPVKRKLIYNLSRKEGMSYFEIADYLNISVKTVEGQMSAALKFLKENLLRLSIFLYFFFSSLYEYSFLQKKEFPSISEVIICSDYSLDLFSRKQKD